MTLILNLIPAILFFICVFYWRLSKRPIMAAAVFVSLMIGYMLAQPSYFPKGTVERIAVPDFEASNAEIQDRLRKTDALKNYKNAQEMHEKFMSK